MTDKVDAKATNGNQQGEKTVLPAVAGMDIV